MTDFRNSQTFKKPLRHGHDLLIIFIGSFSRRPSKYISSQSKIWFYLFLVHCVAKLLIEILIHQLSFHPSHFLPKVKNNVFRRQCIHVEGYDAALSLHFKERFLASFPGPVSQLTKYSEILWHQERIIKYTLTFQIEGTAQKKLIRLKKSINFSASATGIGFKHRGN